MRKIYHLPFPHIRQTSIESIFEFIFAHIIRRVKPFFLQLSPKSFRNIQVRRIRRQKEQIQSSFLPVRHSFLYGFSFMYTGIIQNYKSCTLYFKREFLEKNQYEFRIYILLCDLPKTLTLPVDNPKTIDFVGFVRQKTYILIGKLPTIMNIAFTANVCLVPIVKVYSAFYTHIFKLL